MCIFLYLIVIKCHAKKLNLYTNYKEELTETFDYSLFQPYYKVCFMKIIELEKKLLDIFDVIVCLLYTSPSPRDATLSRMPSSA